MERTELTGMTREEITAWIREQGLPAFRGKHLSPILIEHARRRGGALGYDKIYLATEHTNYYEKYGFYTIGPDACAWGEPTQMFENTTLPPEEIEPAKKEEQAA